MTKRRTKKRRPNVRRRKATWKPISGKDPRWVYLMVRDRQRKTEIRPKDIISPIIFMGAGVYFYPDSWTVPGLILVGLVAFLFSVITTQKEVKIGIAKDPDWRNHDIDEDVPGKVTIAMTRYVPNARALEKHLHQVFGDSRFTMKKVGRNAGATEWFWMTDAEFVSAQFLLGYHSTESKIRPWILLTTAAVLLIIFINHKIDEQNGPTKQPYHDRDRPELHQPGNGDQEHQQEPAARVPLHLDVSKVAGLDQPGRRTDSRRDN